MTNSVNDPCIQQLSQLFLYEGFKWRMYFPQFFLKWLDPFFDCNHMLDYSRVVCFQIIVCPREHISVLFEQADKGLPLLLCETCIKIDELQILFCSQVYLFVHHGGTMGFAIPWPLKAVFHVIELLERYHTLGDEVSFFVINCIL